jgi:dTDP-4-dehydrorhamnose reductase
MVDQRIIILGISSWLGPYIARALIALDERSSILGSYHHNRPKDPGSYVQLTSAEVSAAEKIFAQIRPHVVVNLLRGESESDFRWHCDIMELTNRHCGYYLYASSANAVDLNLKWPHLESELGQAQSDYGKFKARCEEVLLGAFPQFGIVRFAAVHGFAINRISRTEDFLKGLQRGDHVSFPRGIVQNRLSDRLLSQQIAAVAKYRGKGIFHLGSVDCSDEIDFRRELAKRFGYSDQLVREEGYEECNLVVTPHRLFEIAGDHLRFTEADTLNDLFGHPMLYGYRRG